MLNVGSHFGWWARKYIIIAIDRNTELSVYIQYIIKGKNYIGSSKDNNC
jgi:hypothetical protein